MPRIRSTRLTAIAHTARQIFASSVFTGAADVYSMRIPAGSTYNGPLKRVRRSTDNAVQDFGAAVVADANGDRWLDIAAILAFCGAGDGRVVTWYDSSGIGQQHATQATAAAQPWIVTAGAAHLINGKPTLRFAGGQFLVAANVPSGAAAIGASVVAQVNTATQFQRVLALTNTASTLDYDSALSAALLLTLPSNQMGAFRQNVQRASVAYATGVPGIFGSYFGPTAHTARINGVASAPVAYTSSLAATVNLTIGGNMSAAASDRLGNGLIGEVIYYQTDVSTDARRALESSQGAAWGLALPMTNLVRNSANLTGAGWGVISGATITGPNTVSYPTSAFAGVEQFVDIVGGTASKVFTVAATVRVAGGTKDFRLKNTHGNVADYFSGNFTATTTAQTFAFTVNNTSGVGNSKQIAGVLNASGGGAGSLIIERVGLFLGALTAQQIIDSGGIPITS